MNRALHTFVITYRGGQQRTYRADVIFRGRNASTFMLSTRHIRPCMCGIDPCTHGGVTHDRSSSFIRHVVRIEHVTLDGTRTQVHDPRAGVHLRTGFPG